MIMTHDEIVADYKQAKQPMKQIGILADLNGVKKDEIVAILREAGAELPGNYNKKPKEKPAVQIAAPIPEGKPSIYESATLAIAKLAKQTDEGDVFMDMVRGVLALVQEVEETDGPF